MQRENLLTFRPPRITNCEQHADEKNITGHSSKVIFLRFGVFFIRKTFIQNCWIASNSMNHVEAGIRKMSIGHQTNIVLKNPL